MLQVLLIVQSVRTTEATVFGEVLPNTLALYVQAEATEPAACHTANELLYWNSTLQRFYHQMLCRQHRMTERCPRDPVACNMMSYCPNSDKH
jgi:hypothetical protein